MNRVAVLTSGGDAPGMNAAIRAVVRAAAARDVAVEGVLNGFAGLVAGTFEPLDDRSVGGIVQRGGTILGTRRFPTFSDLDVQQEAIAGLRKRDIDGLVVIGGSGSQQGALALHRLGFPVVGVGSTIDNDLNGTDVTIGVDTALNTATECIDRLKDTASSHHRAFIIEVMGRNSGYLALMSAIASGAETVILPEFPSDAEAVAADVEATYARGKAHYIAVVAEGAQLSAHALTAYLQEHPRGFEARLTVLGHLQRGGAPTVRDRLLASQLGAAAVASLTAGRSGEVIGWRHGAPAAVAMEEAIATCRKVTPELLALAGVLAR
jgi:6-phosphofructokinase 1